MKMSVSVVMPSFNEEKIIAKTVESFYDAVSAQTKNFEFLVIDSSSDNSPEILKKLQTKLVNLKVISTPPKGHGRAIIAGYKFASKEYVFQVDADGQFSAADFAKLYELKSKSDFVLGIRQNRKDPMHRKILSRSIKLVNAVFFGAWIRDANCPFRLIKRDLLGKILKKIDSDFMAPNILITLEAKRRGVNIIEVPVTHFERKTGESISGKKFIKTVSKGFMQLIKWRLKK
jgi:glycosyltransferase involved in cell wall biosynthesis